MSHLYFACVTLRGEIERKGKQIERERKLAHVVRGEGGDEPFLYRTYGYTRMAFVHSVLRDRAFRGERAAVKNRYRLNGSANTYGKVRAREGARERAERPRRLAERGLERKSIRGNSLSLAECFPVMCLLVVVVVVAIVVVVHHVVHVL